MMKMLVLGQLKANSEALGGRNGGEKRRNSVSESPGYRGLRLTSLRKRMQKPLPSANILQLYDRMYDHGTLGRSPCQGRTQAEASSAFL